MNARSQQQRVLGLLRNPAFVLAVKEECTSSAGEKFPCRFEHGEFCEHGLCAAKSTRIQNANSGTAERAWIALCYAQRQMILQSLGHPPFILGKRTYPCPATEELLFVPVCLMTYRRSGPKRVMVQEHPCLFHMGKLCHHLLCARKAHHKGYRCPCPAGDEPIPKTYGHSGFAKRRVVTMVRKHPCQFHPGKLCHHVSCSWEAHRIGYQCQQNE